MSDHLTAFQKALFRRVDEVLYYVWDPIGVRDVGDARDEYESYALKVVGLLLEERGKKALFDHLYLLESERMGLSITEESLAHTKEVVDILHSHYESLKKKADPIGTDNSGAARRRV